MPPYVVLHKKRGQTPLQAIGAWREEHPEYADVPAAYAGRLDPMAGGKLLVLLGDECRQQQKYFRLDKEYVIEVALDLGTDTADALGLPAYAGTETLPSIEGLKPILKKLSGTHTVPYPAFSSKTVSGKPLFMHALEGTLGSIDMPSHAETIYRIDMLSLSQVPRDGLRARIEEALSTVPRSDEPSKALGADFRQDEIRAAWRSLLGQAPDRDFAILHLRITCASGTYMRTLAERIATELRTLGFALSITRTRLGMYKQLGPLGLWLKQF